MLFFLSELFEQMLELTPRTLAGLAGPPAAGARGASQTATSSPFAGVLGQFFELNRHDFPLMPGVHARWLHAAAEKNCRIASAHSAGASTGAQWPACARCTTFLALKRSAKRDEI